MSDEKSYSRKSFFGEFFSLVKKGVANQIDRKLGRMLEAPIRPPGALDEVEFLSACTRCDACLKACPVNAVKTVSIHGGVGAGTPFIDPSAQACVLCPDFPCISVCEPGALLPLPVHEVRMGVAVVDESACQTYDDRVCSLCYDACPFPETAITIDEHFHPKVLEGCVGCGLCQQYCPFSPVGIQCRSPLFHQTEKIENDLYFGLFKKDESQDP